mmetsp:Transcript_41522/g.50329  ORF Transcript_41522/g.50329 Transcript_41522/m.50329 type:complete len:203 (-) Transcript_41522:270-878(-)
MSSGLSPIPEGFVTAIDSLLTIPGGAINRLVTGALEVLTQQKTEKSAPVELVHRTLWEAGYQTADLSSLQSGYRAIQYVYTMAQTKQMSPEELSKAVSCYCSKDTALHKSIVKHWAAVVPVLFDQSKASPVLFKTLKSIDWRVGVSVANDVKGLRHIPFVAFDLQTKNIEGGTSTESFQASLNNFQDFAKEIQAIARVMETM